MIIGITGGTGVGKSTALAVLQSLGAIIVDCDKVYHQLLETCEPMLHEIYISFSDAFVGGVLDRKTLGRIVFNDANALDRLNSITHRYIRERLAVITENAELAAVDAVALIESGIAEQCDCTVAVLAPFGARVQRIMARDGISREYARLRIGAQKPDEFYRSGCDYTLVNDADEEMFKIKCEKLFRIILEVQNE